MPSTRLWQNHHQTAQYPGEIINTAIQHALFHCSSAEEQHSGNVLWTFENACVPYRKWMILGTLNSELLQKLLGTPCIERCGMFTIQFDYRIYFDFVNWKKSIQHAEMCPCESEQSRIGNIRTAGSSAQINEIDNSCVAHTGKKLCMLIRLRES